jgi:hypothetical protein
MKLHGEKHEIKLIMTAIRDVLFQQWGGSIKSWTVEVDIMVNARRSEPFRASIEGT